jgi:hypothetical protein
MPAKINRRVKASRASRSTAMERCPCPCMEMRAMSVKYVSGEMYAIAWPHVGSSASGIKTPLINITGNFTTEAIIFEVAGMLVGGAEKMLPNEAKQRADRMTATEKTRAFDICAPMPRPKTIATREMPIPKAVDARISPMMMVSILTGQDMSLSSVLVIASMGTTMGDIAVAVKKRIIPRSPGIMESTVRFLPMEKERNRKTGNRMPKITTGPLE